MANFSRMYQVKCKKMLFAEYKSEIKDIELIVFCRKKNLLLLLSAKTFYVT